jgi:predicted N-acetyltransferase YhbS
MPQTTLHGIADILFRAGRNASMNTPEPRPPANENELQAVADLVQTVFQDRATTAAHRAIVGMANFDLASLPTVWNDKREAVATVQAVPCDVSLLESWVPAGIITMVATAPEARGRGYMRACMQAAHRWLLDNERGLGILYGVPSIYPKFGYRPVMPRSETHYPLPANDNQVPSRPAEDADLAHITSLFNEQEIFRPCAVRRDAEKWIWTSTYGHSAVRVVEDGRSIIGYMRYLTPDPQGSSLTVIEAACHTGQEGMLLDAIHTHAAARGMKNIVLKLMPDHRLAVESIRRTTSLELNDVEVRIVPPQAGMLCVLDAEAVLQQLRPRIEARLGNRSLHLQDRSGLDYSLGTGHENSLRLEHPADMAHLLTGYPGVPALRQWGRLHGNEEAMALAADVFPTACPRSILAPFWDE